MTFVTGLLIGVAIGILGAGFFVGLRDGLRTIRGRELEELRSENRVLRLVIENGARTARRAGQLILARYLEHILEDEAGA